MESNQRRVISLLVDNQSGVLARVSSLFCRRGFNIDSLTVSATNDPTVSRITVSVSGTEKELQQLILQTERLEVTRQVFVLNESTALERELLLLKVVANVANRAELREIAGIYKAKIIDLSPDSMVFEEGYIKEGRRNHEDRTQNIHPAQRGSADGAQLVRGRCRGAECIPLCDLQRDLFYGPIPGGRGESGSDAEQPRRLRGKPGEL